MLETIALDDFAVKKLEMFHQLFDFDDGVYSPRFFKQYSEFSYARLISLFSEMNEDFQQQADFSLLSEDGKVVIDKEELIKIPYQQFLFQISQ